MVYVLHPRLTPRNGVSVLDATATRVSVAPKEAYLTAELLILSHSTVE
jgi:hypothetical protein